MSLAQLLAAARLLSQFELAKSKNARNWRMYEGGDPANGPLKPRTIDQRMDRYLTGRGLSLGHDPYHEEDEVAPTPHGNHIETDRVNNGLLTSEHEGAHALMTPAGKKLRGYFKWLHGQNEEERTTRHFRDSEAAQEQRIPGVRHENIAQALSPKIQRRAGVAPGAQNHYWPHNDRTPEENQQHSQHRSEVHGDTARKIIRRWDRGRQFTSEGVPVDPHGPDAAINERARVAKRPPKEHVQGVNVGGGNLLTSAKQRLNLQVNRGLTNERGRVAPAPLLEPKGR